MAAGVRRTHAVMAAIQAWLYLRVLARMLGVSGRRLGGIGSAAYLQIALDLNQV